MRALALFLGFLAGAATLAFLGAAQLIWAQSEASYYLQLALAAALLIGIFFLARKASTRSLSISVLTAACLTAFMPFENRFIAFLSIAERHAASGDEMAGAAGFTGQLTSIAIGWLFYAVLLAVFAFGMRRWLDQGSRASK
jgi:hypothetical protein